MSDTMTYLTDATMITAVVPAGRADDLLKAARDVGASGGIVHQARGTGARELLGLLGIVVEAEREVVNIVVPADYQELVTNAIFHAGGLGKPGEAISTSPRWKKWRPISRGLHGPPAGGRLSG